MRAWTHTPALLVLLSPSSADVDGDEMITHAEFREGVKSLQTQLGTKFSKKQIDSLLHYIDADNDGTVSRSRGLDSQLGSCP